MNKKSIIYKLVAVVIISIMVSITAYKIFKPLTICEQIGRRAQNNCNQVLYDTNICEQANIAGEQLCDQGELHVFSIILMQNLCLGKGLITNFIVLVGCVNTNQYSLEQCDALSDQVGKYTYQECSRQ
jgi:hypothetical protein